MTEVIHQPGQQRFVVQEEDGSAEITYELLATNVVTITHTFVPPEWRGRGVAAALLIALLEWVEQEKRWIASQCSYATAFLAKHAKFNHLQPPANDHD
jgi:predicted GNAT family acetyltransferase